MKREQLSILLFFCSFFFLPSVASDSLLVEKKLAAAAGIQPPLILHYAKTFLGTPYVGGRLDLNADECLVVNLRELDCTTFVEYVLALTLTSEQHKTDYASFCNNLRKIRYLHGNVHYTSRLHYFSQWIAANTAEGIVSEQQPIPAGLSRASMRLLLNYMSTHSNAYPMLVKNPEWLPAIAEAEKRLSGTTVEYIPKGALRNWKQWRDYLRDGDIIAIVTNKPGLDISHVGFLIWKEDGPHLFHASSQHGKVLVESRNLYEYMRTKPAQIGIRVVRHTL